MNSSQKDELETALLERSDVVKNNKLKEFYFSNACDKQKEFHTAGATHNERLFMAGNQLGKTLSGGAETAMHLTGLYPDWWQGKRFNEPVRFWAASVTGEGTRDNPQRALIGNPEQESEWGTGLLPKDTILGTRPGMGTVNLLDHVSVKHISGGKSYCGFKHYSQGREKWQGPTLHGVWFDEEPPLDIYSEGKTRTNKHGIFTYMTFTPLLGMSEVVHSFLTDEQQAT